MNPLAYTTSGEWHWLEHVIAGSMIRRAIWSLTRGMTTLDLVLLALLVIAGVMVLARRQWR